MLSFKLLIVAMIIIISSHLIVAQQAQAQLTNRAANSPTSLTVRFQNYYQSVIGINGGFVIALPGQFRRLSTFYCGYEKIGLRGFPVSGYLSATLSSSSQGTIIRLPSTTEFLIQPGDPMVISCEGLITPPYDPNNMWNTNGSLTFSSRGEQFYLPFSLGSITEIRAIGGVNSTPSTPVAGSTAPSSPSSRLIRRQPSAPSPTVSTSTATGTTGRLSLNANSNVNSASRGNLSMNSPRTPPTTPRTPANRLTLIPTN